MKMFLTAFLLALDSVIVAAALSPLLRSGATRLHWAAWFGICDGLAVLIGAACGLAPGVFSHLAGPLIVLCFGVYCLVAACWNTFRADLRLALLLPVLMSLDNLAYGASSGSPAAGLLSSALVCSVASFAMALAGFSLGGLVKWPDGRKAQFVSGLALLAGGATLFFL
jgi:putative Mn2+ efflux pump MntP